MRCSASYRSIYAINGLMAYPPYDTDNFYITGDLMNMSRYFRNRFKSSVTSSKVSEIRLQASLKTENSKILTKKFATAMAEKKTKRYVFH